MECSITTEPKHIILTSSELSPKLEAVARFVSIPPDLAFCPSRTSLQRPFVWLTNGLQDCYLKYVPMPESAVLGVQNSRIVRIQAPCQCEAGEIGSRCRCRGALPDKESACGCKGRGCATETTADTTGCRTESDCLVQQFAIGVDTVHLAAAPQGSCMTDPPPVGGMST